MRPWTNKENKYLFEARNRDKRLSFGQIAIHLGRTRNSVISHFFERYSKQVFDWDLVKRVVRLGW